MRDLSLLTWNEVKNLNKEKSILFITVAPLEEHGLCLPLATDVIEGEYWSRTAAKIIEQNNDFECFYLPSFPIASASVNSFYGCIHFSMRTTYVVVKEILESVACMGFMHVIVIASHADPEHQIAIEKAVRKANKKHGEFAIAPMGAFFSADELGLQREINTQILSYEETYPDDYHAGWIETSCMMAIDEHYVRSDFENLPASKITERDMISKKKQLKAMAEYGHIGNPAISNKHIGELLNTDSAEFIAEATLKFATRQNYKILSHYFLYDIFFMHIGFLPGLGRVKRKKVTK